jgi:ABC-type transport system involved in multi-copper enzyme maturation permease subunit
VRPALGALAVATLAGVCVLGWYEPEAVPLLVALAGGFGLALYLRRRLVRMAGNSQRSNVLLADVPIAKPASWWRTIADVLRPSLEQNPVLWCEWRCRRASGWMRGIGRLYAVIAVGLGIMAVGQSTRMWRIDNEVPALVNAFVVALGMLLLSVSSVSALAEDRARGTLEILLTTPLRTRSIVWGKWWGAFRRVPLLVVLPFIVAVVVAATGDSGRAGFHSFGKPAGIVLLVLLVLAYGAAITGLGLVLALWIRQAGRAIALSVTAYVLVTVGWVFALMAVFSGANMETGRGLALASPFWGAGVVTVAIEEHSFSDNVLGWAALWVVVYGAAASLLLIILLNQFDRCLGRVNQAEDFG